MAKLLLLGVLTTPSNYGISTTIAQFLKPAIGSVHTSPITPMFLKATDNFWEVKSRKEKGKNLILVNCEERDLRLFLCNYRSPFSPIQKVGDLYPYQADSIRTCYALFAFTDHLSLTQPPHPHQSIIPKLESSGQSIPKTKRSYKSIDYCENVLPLPFFLFEITSYIQHSGFAHFKCDRLY